MAFNLADSHSKTKPKIDMFYVFWLTALHIGAIASFFFFSWTNLFTAIGLYTLGGIGITVGYHRLLTHRSFRTPRWLERIFATMGVLSMEGGPITWVSQHRQHHLESDTQLDPHNIHEGFWHAHMGWIFMRYPKWYEQGQRDVFAPDLQKDAYLRWLDKYHYLVSISVGVLLFVLGGLPLFLWGFCTRLIGVYHATWFVNSAAHLWGYRPFQKEIATNNWWVAMLAFGEGWHNTHHAHPTSARHGFRSWEVDPSWILIWTLSKFGLAKKIRLPQSSQLPWKKSNDLVRASNQ